MDTYVLPCSFVDLAERREKRKYGVVLTCANHDEHIYSPRSPFWVKSLLPASLATTSSLISCSHCCLATQRPSPAAEFSGLPA